MEMRSSITLITGTFFFFNLATRLFLSGAVKHIPNMTDI